MKTFKQHLNEMPVRNFTKIGDFDTKRDTINHDNAHQFRDLPRDSFGRKTDRRFMRHPKTERIIRKGLNWVSQDIDVYVINDMELMAALPGLIPHSHRKQIAKLGLDVDPNKLSIFMVGNGANNAEYGEALGPASGWMMIHRFWQVLYDMIEPRPMGKYLDWIWEYCLFICGYKKREPLNLPLERLVGLPFTMRSARESVISSWDDIMFETLTQYGISGAVKLAAAEDVLERARKLKFQVKNPEGLSDRLESFQQKIDKQTAYAGQSTLDEITTKHMGVTMT